MANSKTYVQSATDDVSIPPPYEDRTGPEKSIKAAILLEHIAQFTYVLRLGLVQHLRFNVN